MSKRPQGRLAGLLASSLVTITLLSGCSPSIGKMKSEALDEIATMDGLSQPMKDEASWRISDFNEKELVERYLAEVRAENRAILAADVEHEDAMQDLVGTRLVVQEGNIFTEDTVIDEWLVLEDDGAVAMSPLIKQYLPGATWKVDASGIGDIELCSEVKGCWLLQLMDWDNAPHAVKIDTSGSGTSGVQLLLDPARDGS